MEKWKKIHIEGISKIEKCVAEFNVWELNISPYAKFKIKVFENNYSKFTGFSNLQVIDQIGKYNSAVGYGNNVEEALEDTINQFIQITSWKESKEWSEKDFKCVDNFDF